MTELGGLSLGEPERAYPIEVSREASARGDAR